MSKFIDIGWSENGKLQIQKKVGNVFSIPPALAWRTFCTSCVCVCMCGTGLILHAAINIGKNSRERCSIGQHSSDVERKFWLGQHSPRGTAMGRLSTRDMPWRRPGTISPFKSASLCLWDFFIISPRQHLFTERHAPIRCPRTSHSVLPAIALYEKRAGQES